jgi:hypothetical protein
MAQFVYSSAAIWCLFIPAFGQRWEVESVYDKTHPWLGEGLPATSVFLQPRDLSVDGQGNLYIIHSTNGILIKVGVDGIARRIAGGGSQAPADGVRALEARLLPRTLAVDSAGTVYFGDGSTRQIYRIDAQGNLDLIAGNGAAVSAGDGGPAETPHLRWCSIWPWTGRAIYMLPTGFECAGSLRPA